MAFQMEAAVPETTRIDRRRARTTRALLDSAARLFAEQGFSPTTVEQIAADADVAIGSIYGNFGDKRGLYLAAVDRALEINDGYQLPIFESDLPAAQKLAASGAAYVRFYLEHPGQFRLVQVPILEPGEGPLPDAARAIQQRVDRIVELMAAAIEQAIGEEAMRPVPPLPAARFLWASLTGAVALNLRPGMLQIGVDQAVEVAQLGQLIIAEGLAGPGLRGPDGLLAPEARELLRSLTAQDQPKEE
jgi:TetR/AcrR family transcriptional regulator